MRKRFLARLLATLTKASAAVLLALLVLEVSFRLAGALSPEKRDVEQANVNEQHHVILCLGDSHTWGAGKGYPARLAERLAARSDRYRVINLGVPGTNTAQLRRRLPGYLDRFHPRAVVMWDGINNSWNQTDTELWSDAGAAGDGAHKRWLDLALERSHVVRFVRAWRREAELNRVLAAAQSYVVPQTAPGRNIWFDHQRNLLGEEDDYHNQGGGKVPPEDLVRVTEADVRWIGEELGRRGIPFVAITYGIGERSVLAVNKGIENAMADGPGMLVASLDAFNAINARYDALGEKRPDLFDKTAHPTQEQYDEIGDLVLQQLDERNLLPGDHKGTISILPLGDSITEKWGKVSYRYWLWQGLHAAGWTNIDFVGTQKDPWGADFDPDHEGHGSWSAQELWHGRPDKPAEGSIDTWLAGVTPDVVLMQMGTNELIRSVCALQKQKRECTPAEQDEAFKKASAEASEAIAGVIEILRKHNPDVAVVLAQIPPIAWVPDDVVRRFNEDGVATLARRLTTARSPIVLVDLHEGIVVAPDAPDSDTTDGVHPNFSGAKKMGARFQRALTGEVLPRLAERTAAR